MEIRYQEHDIDVVFRHFVQAFKAEQLGLRVEKFEANYDPRTGKVIFKLYVEKS